MGVPASDDVTLTRIFTSIVSWHFSQHGYSDRIRKMTRPIVSGSVQLFRKVKEALPPTPAKAHYTFNLRDVARVVFGIMMVPSSAVGDDTAVITRAWTHESLRVFGDRLVDDGDRHMVASFARAILRSTFSEDPDRLLAHLDSDGDNRVDTFEEMSDLMFGDFGVVGGEDSHDAAAVGLMVEGGGSAGASESEGIAAALIGGEQ